MQIIKEMIETLQTDSAIREAEQEVYNCGELLDAREVLYSLRKKYGL